MQTQNHSKNGLQKIGSYLFNFGVLAGIATLTFGLISCGGGGGGTSDSGNTTPTITDVLSGTSYGVVASSVPRALSIVGTNFVNGMTLSITASSGVAAGTITASSVINAGTLAVSAVISSVPSDNYVEFTIKTSSGGPIVASHVLGVAGTARVVSEIKAIFSGAHCTDCHSNGGQAGLNLTDTNALFASGNPGGCSTRLRVTPGDPRRTSSLLIDKIKATSSPAACYGGPMPPPMTAGIPLAASEVQAVVDWVAGGAH